MQRNKVATVYAQSLLEIGKEKSSLEQIKEELESISNVMAAFPEFQDAFLSPRISQRLKVVAMDNVFRNRVSGIIINFLKILIKKKRENQFENIRYVYNDLMDEALNRIHVWVKTAVKPENDFLPKIEKITGQKSGKNAIVHLELDPDILGGTIIQIGDLVADFSVTRELEELRDKIVSCELRSEQIYEN